MSYRHQVRGEVYLLVNFNVHNGDRAYVAEVAEDGWIHLPLREVPLAAEVAA